MADGTTAKAGRAWLWTEFVGFFLVIPVGMALFLPAGALFPVLFGFTALGLWLLAVTPGFDWRELTHGWRVLSARLVAGFGLLTLGVATVTVLLTVPEALFALPRERPGLMLSILAIYPVLSALPQEVIFRPLFFRRYAPLLPQGHAAVVLNAAVFSLAHLIYWSWTVAILTFAGGLVFGWAYRLRRSFPLAVALHAAAGCAIFAAGLGAFFYTGNIDRPF